MNYIPTNREKTFISKKGKFWCDHCDTAQIHDGEKCPICGLKNKRKRLKKYSIN